MGFPVSPKNSYICSEANTTIGLECGVERGWVGNNSLTMTKQCTPKTDIQSNTLEFVFHMLTSIKPTSPIKI